MQVDLLPALVNQAEASSSTGLAEYIRPAGVVCFLHDALSILPQGMR